MNRTCPSCDRALRPRATSCACGWSAPELGAGIKSGDVNPDLGYVQCDWVSGDRRCKYPASLTHSTAGMGPWYCRSHFDCSDPIAGGDIVEASRDYAQETHLEATRKHQDKADAFCLSQGLTTVEEKRQWAIKALKGMLQKAA